MNRGVQARWVLPEQPPEYVAQGPVSRRVLWARGYREPSDVERFLNPRIEDLHSPFGLRDMDRAVERLKRAIDGGEPILLYGDYDVDGTTSIVILKTTLQMAGAKVNHFVPHRIRDGYGMRTEAIEEAARQGVKLVISVDTGIRASSVVNHARQLGIDVIVTDHHLPEAELPPACAVINPNRPDCSYPEKNLCGAVVALKLAQAVMEVLGWSERRRRLLLESFLKMAAIATVADVVSLTGENRTIVKLGLQGFTEVHNPGLRALLRVAGFRDGTCPSAGQVAFRIAPRMNAAGRMDDARKVIDLFFTKDVEEAAALATELQDHNQTRRDTEATIVKAIHELCVETPVTDGHAGLVFSCADWHKGVVGIVASRIVEAYHRPVFVLCEDPVAGEASGSGRSIRGFHLLEALESMADLFTKFGGHRQACGVTLPVGKVEEFRRRFSEYASQRLTPEDFRPVIDMDAIIGAEELNEATVADVCRLAPFGFGNPMPVFGILNAEIAGTSLRGERHVNVGIRQNSGRTIILTGWDWASRIERLRPGSCVHVAVSLDEGSGDGQWRIVLRDVQPAVAAETANVRCMP